jgi:hypothetical protein
MLLTSARISLLDAQDSVVDSLVVRDGRIAFAGRRGDVGWFLHRLGEDAAQTFRQALADLPRLQLLPLAPDHHAAVLLKLERLRGHRRARVVPVGRRGRCRAAVTVPTSPGAGREDA